MIRKVNKGYAIYSHKTGKKISKVYTSKIKAFKRLRQIQYFKNKGK